MRYKRIGYNLNIMRQSACLVINPLMLMALLHSLIARRWIGRQTPGWPRPKAIHFSWLGPELSSVAGSIGAQLVIFFCFRFPVVLFDRPGISICHALTLLIPRICFFIVINVDLIVDREDSLTSKRIVMRTEQPTKCLYHISYGG